MNVQIKDNVGLPIETVLYVVRSLIENRPPKEGSFDYGFETHGAFGILLNIKLPYPIQVSQYNKRKTKKSPIIITIDRHYSL